MAEQASKNAANALHDPMPGRVIISIDMDCFYVACERLLNPDLVGKPVGIQQKYILATCSYEARAHGIHKLQNVKKAKEMYPELILVNGEDLTNYRRFSRAVTRLVKSIIWDRKVERLGMDELFCDVTEMVNAHQKDIDNDTAKPTKDGKVYFSLSKERASEDTGFYYNSSSNPSLVLPQATVSQDTEYSPLLLSAAHLASYIRGRIYAELGFTTSAGIAHNKIIGKLVASLNKPALQTTWNPDCRRWREEQAAFIGGFEIRKLQGFGHAICKTIQENLVRKLGDQDVPETLISSYVRSNLSREDFARMFNNKLGPRLWDLLFGTDEEPVNPSPECPVQISTENSHIGLHSFQDVLKEINRLATHLLQRLEEELTEAPDGTSLVAAAKEAGRLKSVKWAQYPTSLRLTIRRGYERGRESKSVAFPIDALDEHVPAEDRASKLTKGIFTAMLQKILKTTSTDCACYITIVNVGATNFSTSRPNPTLYDALARSKPRQMDPIDLTQLGSDDIEEITGGTKRDTEAAIFIDDAEEEDLNPEKLADDEEDVVFISENQPSMVTCKLCGSRLFSFSAKAHLEYHEAEAGNGSSKDHKPAKKKRKAG